MIFYTYKSFLFRKNFIFSWSHFTQRRKGNFSQVLGNIKKCSDRNMYHILQQAPIRQTIKSSLKLSKHSQVQLLHYSASAVQNSYNSMRIIRPFLDKLRLWQKMLNNLLRKAFKKRNRCHSIPAQVILSISYYTKFSRIIFFFCTFLCF